MSIAADAVWEIRTTGSDNNGGAFITGASGVDYSQQNSAQKSGTDLAVHASVNTKVQPVAAGVSANDVGNVIQITAGAGFTTGFYEITAQDGTYWTLDRSPAATSTTGGTYAMGGALASPGKLSHSSAFGSNNAVRHKAWLKAGTYSLTTTTPGPGGPLDLNDCFSDGLILEGYQTTRGDRGTRPVIDSNGQTGVDIIGGTGNGSFKCIHIEVDGNSTTDINNGIIDVSAYSCVVRNCLYGYGINKGTVAKSAAYDCSTGFRFPDNCIGCRAVNCDKGFNGRVQTRCIAVNCTTGFENQFGGCNSNFCVAYNCGDGFGAQGGSGGPNLLVSCVAVGCSTRGFSSTTEYVFCLGCAGYNNTSGNFGSGRVEIESLTLTADPFVDAAGGDFSLNNTAGGGAVLRGAGIGTFGQ